jgi:CO/xanthine dehydrogenase Mo-binding subunit
MQLFENFRMHIPYARIVKIDTVAAEKASGAVRVLIAKDVHRTERAR